MIMIIIYISQRAWKAIKPRQIINYDAGIIVSDLHQLNVSNFRQYKISDMGQGNLMSTKNRTHQNNNPQHHFPNQMIEQINIALE